MPCACQGARFSAFFSSEEFPMLDAILLAGGIGLFALTIAYAYACDRL
jgi:hypothetical protein